MLSAAWVQTEARASETSPSKLILQGDQLLNAGDAARALDFYRGAINAAQRAGDPLREAQATNNLGAAHLILGQDQQARELFKQASELGRASGSSLPAKSDQDTLLINGGFESGLLPPWGTGHYERQGGKFRFGIWWNSMNARSFFKIDSTQAHSGQQSLQIRNFSKPKPHVFGTTSQRTESLTPNTVYRLSLWAKAKELEKGAVSFTIDPGWNQRPINLPGGSYDWRRFTSTFCIGPLTFIDFRIIHQAPGTVWLDDISIVPVPPESSEGDAQASLAACDLAAGRYQAALDHYTQLLDLYTRQKKQSAQAHTYLEIGRVQFRLGYYARALSSFQKASDLAKIPTDIELGDLYVELGDYNEAEKNYQTALKRVWGDQATRSRVFKRLGVVANLGGQNDLAIEYFDKALLIQRHIGDQASAAETLLEVGQLKQRLQLWGEAEKAYQEALSTSRQMQNRQLEADIETSRAFLYLERKLWEEARPRFRRSVELQRALQSRRGLVLALYGAGRASEEAAQLEPAEEEYKEAVELLESIRLGFPEDSPLRDRFMETNRQIYARLVGVLLQQGKGEEALEYLERSRSKSLRDQFNHVDIAFRDKERKASWERERALAARHQAQESRLAAEVAKPSEQRNPEVIEALEDSLSVTTKEYRNFLYDLFRRYPDLRYHVSVDPKELKRQRTALPDHLALVEYLMGDDELYCFVLTRQELKVKVVPVTRSTLEGKVSYLLSLAGDTALARSIGPIKPESLTPKGSSDSPFAPKLLTSFRQTSDELYGYLIRPIANEIASKRIVGIAPEGRLAMFPFQLLGFPDDGRFHWLLEDHALFYFHSLDFLRPTHEARGPGANALTLVAFGNADGTLPHSEAEVRSLKLPGSKTEVYLREEATEQRVKQLTVQTSKLHLATHGVLDYTDIRKSYFSLAPDPAAVEDGRLTLGEVWGLPLEHINLVTLSACRTAVGEVSASTGIVNPATAFLDAGARSVVASLWVIDDESTSKLVKSFYNRLAATSTAEALREAQLSLAGDDRYAFPYYWGAFVLLGGWQ